MGATIEPQRKGHTSSMQEFGTHSVVKAQNKVQTPPRKYFKYKLNILKCCVLPLRFPLFFFSLSL